MLHDAQLVEQFGQILPELLVELFGFVYTETNALLTSAVGFLCSAKLFQCRDELFVLGELEKPKDNL